MAHWRYSGQPVRFFFLDSRASFLFLVLILHIRLWTLGLCSLGLMVFFFLERKGLSVPQALSSFRHALAVFIGGKVRPGTAFPKNKRWKER